MRDNTAQLFRRLFKVLKPPPDLTLSEWADGSGGSAVVPAASRLNLSAHSESVKSGGGCSTLNNLRKSCAVLSLIFPALLRYPVKIR